MRPLCAVISSAIFFFGFIVLYCVWAAVPGLYGLAWISYAAFTQILAIVRNHIRTSRGIDGNVLEDCFTCLLAYPQVRVLGGSAVAGRVWVLEHLLQDYVPSRKRSHPVPFVHVAQDSSQYCPAQQPFRGCLAEGSILMVRYQDGSWGLLMKFGQYCCAMPFPCCIPRSGRWASCCVAAPGGGGGATPRVLGRQLPLPPPLGAFGQQLVAKGAALRRPWAPKAPDAP